MIRDLYALFVCCSFDQIKVKAMLMLDNMSRTDKLKLMEALWDDLTAHATELSIADWHADALNEAQQAYASGQAKFIDWAEAKQKLRGA